MALQMLFAAAKELQQTAMTAKVGAVTVSDKGTDLERQIAAVLCAERYRDRLRHLLEAEVGIPSRVTGREHDAGLDATIVPFMDADGDAVPQCCAHSASSLLETHEELARSRSVLQLSQIRSVVLDAVYGEETGPARSQQKQALKAAITDRDRLVLDLCSKVAMLRDLEAQVCALRKERCLLMEHNRELADAKIRLETQRREQGRSGLSEARSEIKLEKKRNIILRNVLAALVHTIPFPLFLRLHIHTRRLSAFASSLSFKRRFPHQIIESGVDWSQEPDLSDLVMDDSSHLLTLV